MTRPTLLVLALSLAAALGCGATVGVEIPTTMTGMGRACGDDVPPTVLAARAVASFWSFPGVADLQLVEIDRPGLAVALFRILADGFRPQEIHALVVRLEGSCVSLVSEGEPCDPLGYSPVPLDDFPGNSVTVAAAVVEAWPATGEAEILVAAEGTRSVEIPGGLDSTTARGSCAFELVELGDGTLVPYPILGWLDSAEYSRTSETATESRTTVAVTLTFGDGMAPQPATLTSDAIDSDCGENADGEIACAGRLTRTTEVLELREAGNGSRRYETSDVVAEEYPVDLECLEAPEADPWTCRIETEVTAEPQPESGPEAEPAGPVEIPTGPDAIVIEPES